MTRTGCVINKRNIWKKRRHDEGSTFSLVLETILEASIMDVWKMLFGFPDYFWIWLMTKQNETPNSILKSYMNLCFFNWRKLRNQVQKTTVIGSWSRARIYDRHHHHPRLMKGWTMAHEYWYILWIKSWALTLWPVGLLSLDTLNDRLLRSEAIPYEPSKMHCNLLRHHHQLFT